MADDAPEEETVETTPPEPEPEPEFDASLPKYPSVQLSPVCVQIWFPEPKWKLLNEPAPPPVKLDAGDEEEGEEEEPPPAEEEPPPPEGPTKQLLYELIPSRIADSAACQEYNKLMKLAMKVEDKWKVEQETEAFAELEDQEGAKAAGEAKVAAAKAAAAEAEAKYQEIKTTYESDPICTKEWMNNLLDVAKAGVQTFVVGGTFWPCTDMMNLFTARTHFKDCEQVLTVFKNRYIVERSKPMSFYFKMVPNIFLETDEAPIDYNPLLNDMLKSTGQEVADEPEEGAAGPKLDLVQLYWWDCDFSDYVKAAKTILATGKVTALGLVNFPLPALKNLHRAGVDIATLEVNYPIGALERKEYTEVIDFCAINGIKVLLSNALVGGIMSGEEMGKLMCPGDSFRERIDPQGPLAEGKFRIQEFGGWIKFQALLMCLDEIAKKHKTTLEAVALRYYINKGVHPIIPVPWGKDCAKKFPDLKLVHTDFLEPADMQTISTAFKARETFV